MTTFSEGGETHIFSPNMPGSPTHSLSSNGDMRFYLQNLLDSKEKQLQQAGTLGQQLLAQRMELEERIRQLQEMDLDVGDDDDVEAGIREKYRDLADTIKTWDTENEQLSSSFSSKQLVNGSHSSPPSRSAELSRSEIERSFERSKASASGTTAAQSSRRAKNAAHRADDVEFAFEIGSGLLTEVRRLQSLLAERDKAIQDMKEEKDDLEKSIENLRTALRQQEQSADKFKEENWNLEVTLQELRAQLADSQATTQRLEGEHKRLAKVLTATREAVDQHKNEADRHQNAFLELKAKHETDIAQARKHAASLQRDKSDLQQSLDSVKAEAAKAQRRLPRFGSPFTPGGHAASDAATPVEEDDVFSNGGASTNRKKLDTSGIFPADGFDFADESPEASPSRPRLFIAPNHPSNEIEALQQKLAHAQRQINTLKGSLQREKEMRIEYRRKLEATPQRTLEDEEEEEIVEEEADEQLKSKRRGTQYTSGGRRGRGRGRGGMTLMQRLAAHSPSSDYADEDDLDEIPPTQPLTALSLKHQEANEEQLSPLVMEFIPEEDNDVPHSPTQSIKSKRTSVEGMDPAFANILRRSGSQRSAHSASSPFRHAVFTRSTRGGGSFRRRGGAAFQEARPASLVGQSAALAAELGFSLEDTMEVPEPTREMVEFGCQTELEESTTPEVVATEVPFTPASPEVSEMGIQVEPEPEAIVIKSDAALQTEAEPIVSRLETGIQHEDLMPRTIHASTSVSTDPIPEPVVELVPPVGKPILTQAEVQTEPISSVDMNIQTVEVPAPKTMHVDTQTMVEPLPVMSEVEIQTTAVHLPVVSEVETQTMPEPVLITSEAEIQTPLFVSSDAQIQTVVEADMLVLTRKPSYAESSVGESSGDVTLTPRAARTTRSRPVSSLFGDSLTETGSFIETETDDFVDARQSIRLVTPTTDTNSDYHSIMTVTDNDFSESDDDESIKASRLSSRQGMSSSVSVFKTSPSSPVPPSSPPPPLATYDSKAIETEPEPKAISTNLLKPESETPAAAVAEPVQSKPELKEMSIQTDWSPPVLFPPSTPGLASPSIALVPSPTLTRVGAPAQQFQFISPPPSAGPTTTSLPIATPSPDSTIRDSAGRFIPRPRTSQSDRRQSIEATLSSVKVEDIVARSRTPSNVTVSPIDKTRPPVMVLPPPPRMPPPPNSMPPPSFIPERRLQNVSGSEERPPRPLSPPPPELIQRATTPTFGAVLSVPGARPFGLRQHPSNLSSQGGMRQPPSTSSFRSAQPSSRIAHASPNLGVRERLPRELSTTSLVSGGHSMESQRSSLSSDHDHGLAYDQPSHKLPNAPITPERNSTMTGRVTGGSTDPTIIHAITQTMIGEFLYKYTRKTIGKGHGDRRHKRFFWVHPYTRTLYWSSADPGSSNVSESSAKSAYVEGVRSVLDPNPMPPGIYQYSVVVTTPQREMKFTAPTKERHDIWLNALQYLMTRPNSLPGASPGNLPTGLNSPMSINEELPDADTGKRPSVFASPKSQRSVRTSRTGVSVDSWHTTPRGQRSQSQLSMRSSMGKRSGTPAAEYLRWNGSEAPYSPVEQLTGQDDDELDFELHGDAMSDDGFEGLENVRACCDGRHTVGRPGHHHHDHHHHHPPAPRDPPPRDQHLDPSPRDIQRPLSPAWSFRSRAGSTTSNDGTGFFSRFGSRRSHKTIATVSGV